MRGRKQRTSRDVLLVPVLLVYCVKDDIQARNVDHKNGVRIMYNWYVNVIFVVPVGGCSLYRCIVLRER